MTRRLRTATFSLLVSAAIATTALAEPVHTAVQEERIVETSRSACSTWIVAGPPVETWTEVCGLERDLGGDGTIDERRGSVRRFRCPPGTGPETCLPAEVIAEGPVSASEFVFGSSTASLNATVQGCAIAMSWSGFGLPTTGGTEGPPQPVAEPGPPARVGVRVESLERNAMQKSMSGSVCAQAATAGAPTFSRMVYDERRERFTGVIVE